MARLRRAGNLRGSAASGSEGGAEAGGEGAAGLGVTVYLIGIAVPALCCMIARCAYGVVAQVAAE